MNNKKVELKLGTCSKCGREDYLRNGVCYACWSKETKIPTKFFFSHKKVKRQGGKNAAED